jgi:hypothetical protein
MDAAAYIQEHNVTIQQAENSCLEWARLSTENYDRHSDQI